MTRLQKRCGLALAGVLAALALITYVSVQIAHARLPAVLTYEIAAGELGREKTKQAVIETVERITLTLPVRCEVVKTLSYRGDRLNDGRELLLLNTDALTLERLRLSEELSALAEEAAAEPGSYAAALRAERETALLEALSAVDALLSANGRLTSPAEGYLHSIATGTVPAREPLAVIGCASSGMVLRWELPEAEAFSRHAAAECSLPVVTSDDRGNVTVSHTAFSLDVARRTYDRNSGTFSYESSVVTQALDLEDGQRVHITLKEPKSRYPARIPLSAAEFISDNVVRVYALEKTEDGLKVRSMQLTICARDNRYIALRSELPMTVVTYADKPLKDGALVRLLDG